MKTIANLSLILTVMAIIGAIGWSIFLLDKSKYKERIDLERASIKIDSINKYKSNTDSFSHIQLKEYLLQLNIKYPDVVFAQAVIETGNFKSKVFRENNNLFGMKLAKQRYCVANGSKYGYAVYSTWKESVIDYAFYQATYADRLTKKQYIRALQRRHCSDKNYTKLINQIIKQL